MPGARRAIESDNRIIEATYRATFRGRALTLTFKPTQGRPRLTVTVAPTAHLPAGSTDIVVYPSQLAANPGTEAKAVAVAASLRFVAAPGDRCQIRADSLTYETEALVRSRAWLLELLEGLVTAEHCARSEGQVSLVLQKGARSDTDADLRARCLALLIERASSPAERLQVAIRALVDRDPRIRLLGATEVGALGLPTLRVLAMDEGLSVADRVRAVEFMVGRFGDQLLLPTLVNIACRAPAPVASAAVTGIAGVDAPMEIIDALARTIRAPAGALSVRSQALTALGRVDRPQARAALAAMLEVLDEPIVIGVIEMLGEVGTVESVGPLRSVMVRGGEVLRAAQRALEAVRRRSGGRGALSLASDDEAGRLSSPLTTPSGRDEAE